MDALSVLLEEMRALRQFIEEREQREGRPLALTYTKAGALISRGPKTIARMVERGELLSIRGEGKSRLIATKELERWVAERSPAPQRRSGGPKKREAYSLAEDLARLRATKLR